MPIFVRTIAFEAVDSAEADAIEKAVHHTLTMHGVMCEMTIAAQLIAQADVAGHSAVQLLFTDGGCQAGGGIGAWAFILDRPDGTRLEQCDGEMSTTNNRMELLAVIKGLEACECGPPVLVVSDSAYVVAGITLHVAKWIKRGWKTVEHKDVSNIDLWRQLLALTAVHDVSFSQCKGHSGHPQNERCDKLCTRMMMRLDAQQVDDHQGGKS